MNKPFLTYFEYFATGEGMTASFAFTFAKTANAAKENYLLKHVCREDTGDSPSAQCLAYFRPGVSAISYNKRNVAKIRKIMSRVLSLSQVDYTLKALDAGANVSLSFKSHVNYN